MTDKALSVTGTSMRCGQRTGRTVRILRVTIVARRTHKADYEPIRLPGKGTTGGPLLGPTSCTNPQVNVAGGFY